MDRPREPEDGRYIVRPTKGESPIEAMAAANEFADSLFMRANSDQARKTTTGFECYANQMLGMPQALGNRQVTMPVSVTAHYMIKGTTPNHDKSASSHCETKPGNVLSLKWMIAQP